MKIGLGTAQFGLDYGVSNLQGMTRQDGVRAILSQAAAAGVRVVDTAPAYGVAEQVLGECGVREPAFQIVTKVPPLSRGDVQQPPASRMRSSLLDSLASLRVESVYGLLLHDAQDLLGPDAALIYGALKELRTEGLVQRIGISVYTADQIDAVLRRYDLDLIQLPLNVLDQRLLQGGQLDQLKARGVEIHVRSIFLQGLLLMEVADLPVYFSPVRDHLTRYRADCQRHGLSALQAALAFVHALPQVDTLVCGVNSGTQLQEILEAASISTDTSWMCSYALRDPAILNPSLWPAHR